MFEIKEAKPSDAAALLAIYAPYVRESAVSFEYEAPSVEEFASRIAAVLQKYPYLVACEGEKALGYASAAPFKRRAAYDWAVETSIYVAQGERGRGIGRALYAALEGALSLQGVRNMCACVAWGDDEYVSFASALFHKKMGFSQVAHFHGCGFKFGRRYDMIWLEKIIASHESAPAPLRTWDEVKQEASEKLGILI